MRSKTLNKNTQNLYNKPFKLKTTSLLGTTKDSVPTQQRLQ